jgi:hypothetical protein
LTGRRKTKARTRTGTSGRSAFSEVSSFIHRVCHALQPSLVYQGGGTLVWCLPRVRAFK